MSTILKTLKKLEEEKSVLDRNVDLKELVLKDDLAGVLEEETGERPWLVSALFFLSFLLGGLGVYLWLDKAPPQKEPVASMPQKAQRSIEKTPASPSPTKKAALPVPVPTGIPLASIPGSETGEEILPDEEFLWEEEELEIEFESGPEQAALVEAPMPPASEVPPAAEAEAGENAIPVPAEVQEIDAIIKNATQAALETPSEPLPRPTAAANEAPRDLKVKAIIFFDDGNPANHIFVSTPKAGSLKMKVGDEVEGARLTAIAPNRVVFDNLGKPVEIRIGH